MESYFNNPFGEFGNIDKTKLINNDHKLSDFQIENQLSKNNSSSVYLVKYKLNNKLYILKEIKLGLNTNEIQRLLLLKEIKLLENLDNPHITQYLSSFIENGNIFIIIEYVDGINLYTYFKTEKEKGNLIEEKKIFDFCIQILRGLYYLHNRQTIIHRNIKPNNILIDKNDNVKITDYGISSLYLNNLNNNKFPNGEIYDYKSDVYMLGLTFYNLIVGELNQNNNNIIGLNIDNTLPDYYSKDLKHFIKNILKDNIKERPTAKSAFIEALYFYSFRYLGMTSIISTLRCFLSIPSLDTYFGSEKIKYLITNETEKGQHLITERVKIAFDSVNSYNFDYIEAKYKCSFLRLRFYMFEENLSKMHEIRVNKFIPDLCTDLRKELNQNKYCNNNSYPGRNTINEEFFIFGNNEKEQLEYDDEEKVNESTIKKLQEKYRSKISDLLYFISKTIYRCFDCKNKIKIETNFYCSFDACPGLTAYNLGKIKLTTNDLLGYILRNRNSEKENIKCKYCDEMKKNVLISEKLYFPPLNMIITFDNSYDYKFEFQVEEFIDISSFVERKDINSSKYRLIGAIFTEQIDEEPKRYVSYTKEKNGQWKYFNKRYISDSNFNEIKNHDNIEALFYTSLF